MRPVSAFAKVGIFALIAGAVGAVGAVWWLPDWLPPAAAVEAHREDTLYLWLLVVSALIFSLVVSFLGYSMWKFRARPGDMSDGAPIHGHTGLEMIWTVIPIVIVLAFAVAGTVVLNRNESLTKGHLVVNVTGRQFSWSFTYPKYGHLHSGVLALPEGRQVEFRLHAPDTDVIHGFYIPAFRISEDVVPGTPTTVNATPDRLGTYTIVCNELCGIGHSQMRALAVVMTPTNFTKWIAQQQKLAKAPPPAQTGGSTDAAATFKSAGCSGCHTFTPAGATGTIGPNLDHLVTDAAKYGQGETAQQYVRESIIDPGKVVVTGYPNGIMPTTFATSLTSAQVDALVSYLLKGGG
jgi:cytochrome c oxidase subunit II